MFPIVVEFQWNVQHAYTGYRGQRKMYKWHKGSLTNDFILYKQTMN